MTNEREIQNHDYVVNTIENINWSINNDNLFLYFKQELSEIIENEIIRCPVCREFSFITNLNTNLHALAFTKYVNLLKLTKVDELETQLDDINLKIKKNKKEVSFE